MIASLLVLVASQAVMPMQAPLPQDGREGAVVRQGMAPAAPTVMPGQPVVNANGNAVGRVVAADGSRIVIDTGAQRMSYPSTRFSPGNGSVVFDLTQAQVDAEALSSQGDMRARLMTVLIPGAAVRDPSGTLIGTVEGVGASGVTVSSGSTKTAVPATAFSMDANGGLVMPVSAAEFSAPR